MSSTESALPDTPVMRQYQDLKKQHPHALLFFRVFQCDFFIREKVKVIQALRGAVRRSPTP